jgi:hypothetical protein
MQPLWCRPSPMRCTRCWSPVPMRELYRRLRFPYHRRYRSLQPTKGRGLPMSRSTAKTATRATAPSEPLASPGGFKVSDRVSHPKFWGRRRKGYRRGQTDDPIRAQCREGDPRLLREASIIATSTLAPGDRFPRFLRRPCGFPGAGTRALLSGTRRRAPIHVPEDCSLKLEVTSVLLLASLAVFAAETPAHRCDFRIDGGNRRNLLRPIEGPHPNRAATC